MARLLVAEDSATQAVQIRILLENAGYEVQTAVNGRLALEALAVQQPDAVLTDLDMPEMNGLELVEAIRDQYSSVPVVLMTAYGSEEVAIQALERGAASYVPKKNLQSDLISTLNDVLSVVQAHKDQERLIEYLDLAEAKFCLDNDANLVMPIVAQAQAAMSEISLVDETERIRVGVALETALHQAMYHSNLELTANQLQDAYHLEDGGRSYYEMLERRRSEPPFCDRSIEVRFQVSRAAATFSIRVEGPGFSEEEFSEGSQRPSLDSETQRGWLLIKAFMDDVVLAEDGRCIIMTKRAQRMPT